jgi:predicted PurR-regulated permease PerM
VTTGQRQQTFFWLGALAVFFGLFYLLSPILLPFVAGFVIAYFLDPAVYRLERWHVRRSFGTVAVLLLFVLAVLLVLSLLVPLVELQAAELVRRVPALVGAARERIEQLMHLAEQQLAPEDVAKVRDIVGSGLADIAGWAVRLVQTLLTSSVALANLL